LHVLKILKTSNHSIVARKRPPFLPPGTQSFFSSALAYHELADGVEHNLELGVVFFLQISQLPSQLRIRREQLPKPNERAYDFDIDRYARLLRRTLESTATPAWHKEGIGGLPNLRSQIATSSLPR